MKELLDRYLFKNIIMLNFPKEILKNVHNKNYKLDVSYNRTYLFVTVPINTMEINKMIEDYLNRDCEKDVQLLRKSIKESLDNFIKNFEYHFLDIGERYSAYYEKYELKWEMKMRLSFIYAIKLVELNNTNQITH